MKFLQSWKNRIVNIFSSNENTTDTSTSNEQEVGISSNENTTDAIISNEQKVDNNQSKNDKNAEYYEKLKEIQGKYPEEYKKIKEVKKNQLEEEQNLLDQGIEIDNNFLIKCEKEEWSIAPNYKNEEQEIKIQYGKKVINLFPSNENTTDAIISNEQKVDNNQSENDKNAEYYEKLKEIQGKYPEEYKKIKEIKIKQLEEEQNLLDQGIEIDNNFLIQCEKEEWSIAPNYKKEEQELKIQYGKKVINLSPSNENTTDAIISNEQKVDNNQSENDKIINNKAQKVNKKNKKQETEVTLSEEIAKELNKIRQQYQEQNKDIPPVVFNVAGPNKNDLYAVVNKGLHLKVTQDLQSKTMSYENVDNGNINHNTTKDITPKKTYEGLMSGGLISKIESYENVGSGNIKADTTPAKTAEQAYKGLM